ncbi:hypothetical protein [Cupriavidus basilensis]|uniref:hypothetical protein n=1 Tax=Cupriavidus basilensis TaxID=68895 RepID=UPI0023E8CF6C|nr:hypothetical protein [Cupriavidus basilensis]MDF3887860.1 hypothetical protein [Cupriavidus basilensis]
MRARHAPNRRAVVYSDFLAFKLDLTSALLIDRANVAYRERWNLDVRALRVLRLVCAEPDTTPKEVSRRTLVEKRCSPKFLPSWKHGG